MSVTITPRKRRASVQGGTAKKPRSSRTLFAASAVGLARAAQAYAPARVPRGMNGHTAFPQTKTVKMRYADFDALAGTSGVVSEVVYRANSIFDPYETGVGHKAMGHDQWAVFYEHYTVTKSKITIVVTPTGAGLTSPPIVGVALVNSTSLDGNAWQDIVERGKGVWKQITLSTAAAVGQKLTARFDAKSFFNLQDLKDNQARIGAAMGANPPTGGDAYFIIWGQSQDAAITIACDVTIVIDYTVVLSDPKQMPIS